MGSINKSHNEADGGVLLFNGELILLYCDSVSCEIGGKESVRYANQIYNSNPASSSTRCKNAN